MIREQLTYSMEKYPFQEGRTPLPAVLPNDIVTHSSERWTSEFGQHWVLLKAMVLSPILFILYLEFALFARRIWKKKKEIGADESAFTDDLIYRKDDKQSGQNRSWRIYARNLCLNLSQNRSYTAREGHWTIWIHASLDPYCEYEGTSKTYYYITRRNESSNFGCGISSYLKQCAFVYNCKVLPILLYNWNGD
jgi:hypothetical protein